MAVQTISVLENYYNIFFLLISEYKNGGVVSTATIKLAFNRKYSFFLANTIKSHTDSANVLQSKSYRTYETKKKKSIPKKMDRTKKAYIC